MSFLLSTMVVLCVLFSQHLDAFFKLLHLLCVCYCLIMLFVTYEKKLKKIVPTAQPLGWCHVTGRCERRFESHSQSYFFVKLDLE